MEQLEDRGGWGGGGGVIEVARKREARGPFREKRERDGRTRVGKRGRITETEREIDVEGLSTTDKYYIRASRRRARTRTRSVGVRGTRYVHHVTPAVSLIF